MLKFNLYHVTDGQTKAKVSYSLDNHVHHSRCVTLYGHGYGGELGKLFAEYLNQTDMQSDYFDEGHVTLTPDHLHYAAARAAAEKLIQKRAQRRADPEDTRTHAQRDAASYAHAHQVD